MKVFEKLIRARITKLLPPDIDPLQFAYRANRSTEDAIATALQASLSHLEKAGSYVRLLFVDFSSAFNTILPDRLVSKMADLGLPHQICAWTKNFLSDRPQRVRVGPHLSSTLTLSTGSPQGCVLSPCLYNLYTYDITAAHSSNYLIKFADDTTVVGCISKGDERAYRTEVEQLAMLCKANNLRLNQLKTQEIIVDFRRKTRSRPGLRKKKRLKTDKKTRRPVPRTKKRTRPLLIDGGCVERVSSFRFLGVHIQDNLKWSTNTTSIIKKAQQRLHFLRVLRNYHLRQDLLVCFYRCAVESILTYCICVWFASCTEHEKSALQRVVKSAQRIIGCPLPSMEELYDTRCLRKALKTQKDPTHPAHALFVRLRSGRRFRALAARTERYRRSFYPRAIQALNKAKI